MSEQSETIVGWRGSSVLEAAGLGLSLSPLHGSVQRQAYDAGALRARFGLKGAAVPMRLEVKCREGASPEARELWLELRRAAQAGDLRLEDGSGVLGGLLFHEPREVAVGALPVLNLFDPKRTLGEVERGSGRLILWATEPGEGLRLVAPDFELALAPAVLSPLDLPFFTASR